MKSTQQNLQPNQSFTLYLHIYSYFSHFVMAKCQRALTQNNSTKDAQTYVIVNLFCWSHRCSFRANPLKFNCPFLRLIKYAVISYVCCSRWAIFLWISAYYTPFYVCYTLQIFSSITSLSAKVYIGPLHYPSCLIHLAQ